MQSPSELSGPFQTSGTAPLPAASQGNPKVTPEAFALALLIAASLQIMENLLPRMPLFPWMRVGFSYVIILPFLLQYGPRAALALFLARNVISVLYGGQPLTTFLISSGSGAVAFLGAGLPAAWAYRRGWLGILGTSILLATAFNLAQLAAVNLTLIRHAGFYFQTGPILAWSLVSGAAVAVLIRFSYRELLGLFMSATTVTADGTEATSDATEAEGAADAAKAEGMADVREAKGVATGVLPKADGRTASRPPKAPTEPFLAGLALLIVLFAFPALRLQLPVLAVLLIAVPDRGRMLLYSWPFFFYLAWLHLFHTSGAYLWGEWITREGALNFALYAVRLANLILLGRWLSRRFPWQWIGKSRSVYLQGFLLSLPLLPDMFRVSMAMGGRMLRELFGGKRAGVLGPVFETWKTRMAEAAWDARGS